MTPFSPIALVFYPSQGRWYERVIAGVTRGPFVHVAVQINEDEVIAAETWGIKRESLPPDRSSLTIYPLAPGPVGAQQMALAWLKAKVGQRYGWLDIFDQGLRLVGSPVYLSQPNALDCSDLAACFAALYANDRVLMGQVLDHRQLISPNDLARYYGLIK